MSSGPSDPTTEERRRSLGKYVKRMSSVFKREKSSKSVATTSTAAAATPSHGEPKAQESQKEATTPAPATSTTTPAPAAPPASAHPPPGVTTQQLNRTALQHERARALFAKYGLTLESHEWISAPAPPISVQRVEKPIRMRVHRSCHHCNGSFGPNKVCAQCEHKRCKKCPRFPAKKTPGEAATDKKPVPLADKFKQKKRLTVHTKAGAERVYAPVKMRIRRNCHKCQAFFIPPTATVCTECSHVRCTKCPREPAKLKKYPNGYPGDVEPESETDVERDLLLGSARRTWRRPRQRVRWVCDQCSGQFIEGSPQCPGCGHERCGNCTRIPLKRVKKDISYDPEVIRQVEAKLRAMTVDDEDTAASGVEGT